MRVADAQRVRAPVVIWGQRQLVKREGVKVHIFGFEVGVWFFVGWLVRGLVAVGGGVAWMVFWKEWLCF